MRHALPTLLVATLSTLWTGCRNPEYRIVALEPMRGARGAELIEVDRVRVGMSTSLVCDFDSTLDEPVREHPVGEAEPGSPQLDEPPRGRLLCAGSTHMVYDDGQRTWVRRPGRGQDFEPAADRLVEAVCVADGWVGLTETCELLDHEGHRIGLDACAGQLRVAGAEQVLWLDGTGRALDAHTGVEQPPTDAVVYAGGRRYDAADHVLYGPDWEVELPRPALDLYVVADWVHVRHAGGELTVWDAANGQPVARVADPMPQGGRVTARADARTAFHVGRTTLRPYRMGVGSIRPGAF